MRIHRRAQITNLKMKMRTCGTPRAASVAQQLPCFHQLVFVNARTRQMPIDRFQTVEMPDNNHIAIAFMITRNTHHAIESTFDAVAYV